MSEQLPPLDFSMHRLVTGFEDYAKRQFAKCDGDGGISEIRTLRTCANSILRAYLKHYSSLKNRKPAWLKLVRVEVTQAMLALAQPTLDYRVISEEVKLLTGPLFDEYRAKFEVPTEKQTTDSIATRRRNTIEAFIQSAQVAGRKITRKDIWTVAGYAVPSEFERYQRGDPRTTKRAERTFTQLLAISADEFIKRLDRTAK